MVESIELNESRNIQNANEKKDNEDKGDVFFSPKQKLNCYYVFLSFFILLGPFLMGLMINAVSNKNKIMERFFFLDQHNKKNTTMKELDGTLPAGVLFPFGGLLGALMGGMVIDKCGRKYTTILFSQLMIFGNLLKIISFYSSIWLFYSGRLFDGIASGSLMVVCVTWSLEIQPTRLHSIIKPLFQILINTGILVIALVMSDFALGINCCYAYWIAVIAAILLSFAAFMLPESYKYIYQHTRDERLARNYLQIVRGDGYMEAELQTIINQIKKDSNIRQMSMMVFLKTKKFLPGIISAIFINLAQQVTGINAIAAFTQSILEGMEGGKNLTQAAPSTTYLNIQKNIGLIILSSGLLASIIFAGFVSNYRRKFMLILGFSGMTISLSLTMVLNAYNVNPIAQAICLAAFFSVFQIGPGPLVWFISSEIFPTETHACALSLTTVANWLGNSCIYFLFPFVASAIQIKSLYIFIALNIVTLLFLSFLMEETLHKSPDEVIANYQRRWRMN